MVRTIACLVGVSLLGLASTTADAGPHAAAMRTNNGKCHQKIDSKGLKGAALKSAWQKCKANPDAY